MTQRTRPNFNLRLSREEIALLKEAALLKGFSGWSAYLRHVGVNDARQTLAEHGFIRRPYEPDEPTLWETSR